nr:hypothetical protein CFP56_63060 [Quercus suber]
MLATQQRLHLYATAQQPVTFGRTDAALSAMDEVHTHNGEAQDSGDSIVSDLSALENETDDFGRRLLQHQRDIQRFNASRVPLLKRASGPKYPGRVGREAHSNGADIGVKRERSERTGPREIDPPLNIPRDWGRKRGKRTMDWQRKLEPPEVSTAAHLDRHSQNPGAIVSHKTAYTGDESPLVNWRSRHEPISSIDNNSPSKERPRDHPTPSSMNHMNTTLNEALDVDDQDFTSVSLLASTPAVNRRDRKIDELTRREIETVERRRITRRTLEHMTVTTAEENRPATAPTTSDASRYGAQRSKTRLHNKENMQPNVNNNTLKWTEAPDRVHEKTSNVKVENNHGPAHSRGDSYSLLKQLARVSSMSPSPGRRKIEPKLAGHNADQKDDASPLFAKQISRDDDGSKPTIDASAIPVGGLRQMTTDVKRIDADEKSSGGTALDPGMTPLSRVEILDAKTPVVTGAWPETPAPSTNARPTQMGSRQVETRRRLQSSEAGTYDLKRARSEPSLPKSALADILAEARKGADMQFGESTFASLEDIANPDVDNTDPTVTLELGNSTQDIADQVDLARLSTQAENDRRQEALAIESMSKSLRNARSSIKDASRGLRRVENKMETAGAATDQPMVDDLSSTLVKTSEKSSHQRGKTHCSHCGGLYKSVWRGLFYEFTDCFYTFSEHGKPGFKLTRLGLFCIVAVIWFTLENIACHNYCHPAYATEMIGFGVEPDAPVYPFVIPTLLFRPLRFLWGPLAEYATWIGGVIFEWAVGDVSSAPYNPATFAFSGREIDRSRGRSREAVHTLGATRTVQWMTATAALGDRALRSAADAVDEIGRIWDDEYIS